MGQLQDLHSLEKVEAFISESQLSFLYISRPNCGVCQVLLPQIKELIEGYPKIALGYINADEVEEIAGHFSVFTAPTLLLFVEGKEYIREARFVHVELLHDKIRKIYENVIE